MSDPYVKYSTNEFTGDGVTVERNISFAGGYLLTSHVKSYYINESGTRIDVPLTFVSENRVSTAPVVVPAGCRHVIYRSTPFDNPLADFTDGAVVTEANLDANARQAIFVAAELSDEFRESVDKAGEAADSAADSAAIALNTLAQSAANVGIAAGYAAATAADREQTQADVAEAHSVAATFNGIVSSGSSTLSSIINSGTSSLNITISNGSGELTGIINTGKSELNSLISSGSLSLSTIISTGIYDLNELIVPGKAEIEGLITTGSASLSSQITGGLSTIGNLINSGVSDLDSTITDAKADIASSVAATSADRVQTGLDRAATAIDADRAAAAAAYKTSIARKTYAQLTTVVGSANQTAAVFNDGGSHTDPVAGGTVSNNGLYRYSTSPAGWEWLAPLGGTVVLWADIANKPATFAPAAHTHSAEDVTAGVFNIARIPDLDAGKIVSGTLGTGRIPSLDASKITTGAFDVARIPSLDASKIISGVFDAARIPAQPWSSITGKPTLGTASTRDDAYFALAGHGHSIAGITGLQTALDAKAASSHSHATGDITGLDSALAAKADHTSGTLNNPTINGFTEGSASASGTAFAPNLSVDSTFYYTVTGNCTITLPAVQAGKPFLVVLIYTGAFTVSWAGGPRLWVDGSIPKPTSVNGKRDVYSFLPDETASNWMASQPMANV